MNPKVFGAESSRRERRVIPKTAKVGKVPGWALCFNLKTLPLVEPGMGNIIKEEGAEVHGVAYQITEQDLEKIFRSEGGGTSDAYTIQTLDFYGYDGMHLQVKACYCPPDRSACRASLNIPSLRYITLLRDGARHWALEESYCVFLENHSSSNPHPIVKALLFGLYIPLFLPVFMLIVTVSLQNAYNRRVPSVLRLPACLSMKPVLGGVLRVVMTLLWGVVDVAKRIGFAKQLEGH